jgi:thymidylate synthase (FAD)
MKVIRQSWSFEFLPPNILETIEKAGRTCYKTEEKIVPGTAEKFVKKIIESGHLSVIEHVNVSVRIITDRGVTHELVRHRLAAYSQESTRYCSYDQDKFGNEITVILPVWFYDLDTDHLVKVFQDDKKLVFVNLYEEAFYRWYWGCQHSEYIYFDLLKLNQTPQQARAVLPNSLKTEIVVTANLREWRHILSLRTSKAAHPQIREIMLNILEGFKKEIPVVFRDINIQEG